MKVLSFLAIALFGASGIVSVVHAQSGLSKTPIQPLANIEESVIDFLESHHLTELDSGEALDANPVNVSVKPLDKRLRLADCAEPLEAQWAPGSRQIGRVTVQVNCSSPKPWRIRVQSTVTMEGSVWKLARGVQRGEVMTADHLIQESVILGKASQSVNMPVLDIEPWLGYAFSRRIGAGKVLDERMLKPAVLVSKGKAVTIRHKMAGVSLRANGIALENASAQQRVKVRNQTSGRVVNAIAVSRDVVEVLN